MVTEHKTLLIVDDEETIHRALKRTFRREPYELLHAYDAAEAWAILASHPEVDAVVCDHYMPGTPGLELLMDVRQRYGRLKTVLLTAQADLELVMAAINEGRVHRFFTKPWVGEVLRTQLRELLGIGVARAGGESSRTDLTAERLREELMPMRDGATGAFILEDPNGS